MIEEDYKEIVHLLHDLNPQLFLDKPLTLLA
jgi:hypothetical protein